MELDVIVIGAGISGMACGLRAAQGGLRVAVLEKSPQERYLCNSRLTGGIMHCCLTDVTQDPDHLYAKIREVTGGNARPDLARAIATDGLRTIRWMQSVGIRFIKVPFEDISFMLSPPTLTPQGRKWEGRGGDVMLRTLEAELNKLGSAVFRGYRATQLLIRDGHVIGTEVTTADGAKTTLTASTAIVIADGGFQANEQLTSECISPRPAGVFQRNAGTSTGDGLTMARSVGAATSDLRGFYGHVLSRDAFNNESLWPYPWLDFVCSAGIVVRSHGRRFADEGLGGIHMANEIARQDDPLDCFAIIDHKIWQERGSFGLLPPNPLMEKAGGTLLQGPSLESMARNAGLDASSLVIEVERYNSAISTAQTGSLVPPRTTSDALPAYPIQQAPFYAIPCVAGITYTMGGILINGDGQVLSETRSTIPGLYAVGCAAGGLEGGEHKGYVGGLMKSAVTGLRAAEHLLAS
ncbi:MAG: FAD-dependent oxidoreductase [Pigmentiphaga sp.]